MVSKIGPLRENVQVLSGDVYNYAVSSCNELRVCSKVEGIVVCCLPTKISRQRDWLGVLHEHLVPEHPINVPIHGVHRLEIVVTKYRIEVDVITDG